MLFIRTLYIKVQPYLGKTLFAANAMYRKVFGIRDAHRQIHIISEHAKAGQVNNPLDPTIREAEEDPGGKYVLHPVGSLAEAEGIIIQRKQFLKLNPPTEDDLMDFFFIDDFGVQIRSNPWLMEWLTKCRHPQTGYANVMILLQLLSGMGGLPPQVIAMIDILICNASCNINTKVRRRRTIIHWCLCLCSFSFLFLTLTDHENA